MLSYVEDKPTWLYDDMLDYLTIMGSRAYGTENEKSDYDFYGFCIPPLEIVFPHTSGRINGFGRNIQNFEQFEKQHIKNSRLKIGEFDITIYNIVKYFQLLMEGNPNIVDSLFTDLDSEMTKSQVGMLVKDNRHLFLSQKCYHTFKGMMWSHLSRIKSGHVKEGRKEISEKYGYDVKDAYHSVRMVMQLNDILFTGDMDLKRHKSLLISVRNGKYSKEEVVKFCEEYLNYFENKKDSFVVPYSPNEESIKFLLEKCLELRFGDLKQYGYNIL